MCSRLTRNAETGDSDKEALFASAGGVEVSEFLGGETRQATRGARRWSWTFLKVNFILSYLSKKAPPCAIHSLACFPLLQSFTKQSYFINTSLKLLYTSNE